MNQNGALTGYLRTGAVRDPCIGFEGDHLWVDYRLDFFRRHVSETQRDHEVHFTVTLQDGEVLVATERLWKKAHVSHKTTQSLVDKKKRLKRIGSAKLWRKNNDSRVKSASLPMGKTCEVVASN